MLMLNLKPVLAARGIERPYTYLVKAGFTPSAAQHLLSHKTNNFRLDHIEKLCALLNCTPNDLLSWSNKGSQKLDENHPLMALKRRLRTLNFFQRLKRVSLNDLQNIAQIINHYKMQKKG